MIYRAGIGYDIHRLVEGRRLVLGGIEIPYIKGLLGHSDADVLLHAICDALLGAAGEPDIGELFADSDPAYQGISSEVLLRKVYDRITQKGYVISNIDTVVIAQEPVLSPFKKMMAEKISAILSVPADAVTVKAKTNEGLGEIGSKEAIAVHAVALLRRE